RRVVGGRGDAVARIVDVALAVRDEDEGPEVVLVVSALAGEAGVQREPERRRAEDRVARAAEEHGRLQLGPLLPRRRVAPPEEPERRAPLVEEGAAAVVRRPEQQRIAARDARFRERAEVAARSTLRLARVVAEEALEGLLAHVVEVRVAPVGTLQV